MNVSEFLFGIREKRQFNEGFCSACYFFRNKGDTPCSKQLDWEEGVLGTAISILITPSFKSQLP